MRSLCWCTTPSGVHQRGPGEEVEEKAHKTEPLSDATEKHARYQSLIWSDTATSDGENTGLRAAVDPRLRAAPPCLVETSRVEVLKRAKDTFALSRIACTDSVPQ